MRCFIEIMDSSYKGDWRSTKDPKSGKTYYYNVKTRETTWKMPMEMVSASEQEKAKLKEAESRQFFREMEENILRKMRGQTPLSADAKEATNPPYPMRRQTSSEFTRNTSSGDLTTLRYRTISSVDDEIVELMKYSAIEESLSASSPTGGRSRSGSCVSVSRDRRGSKLSGYASMSPVVVNVHDIADAKHEISNMIEPSSMALSPVKGRKRRNSTGTIYVETTMAHQDNATMIHVVCVVIRAHMLAGEKSTGPNINSEYEVFNEDYPQSRLHSPADRSAKPGSNTFIPRLNSSHSYTDDHKATQGQDITGRSSAKVELPSLKTIKDFFNLIYNKSQLESECIIMTLIYCERLIVKTKGKLCMRHDNWKPILFACIVMASKVWDDLSMWNVDFSHVSSNMFDLKRVNELELALLDAFEYTVKVSASDYAKYYFQLRSLIARLKFDRPAVSRRLKELGSTADENNITLPSDDAYELMPLDIVGARKLQIATEKYETKQASCGSGDVRRRSTSTVSAVSYGSDFKDGAPVVPVPLSVRRFKSDAMDSQGRHHIASEINHVHHPVLLEQLMHAEHNDADGVAHTSSKHSTPVHRSQGGGGGF